MPIAISKLVFDGITAALGAVTNGASKIIEDFRADPNKVLDVQVELEKLKAQALKDGNDYAVQMETQYANEIESVNKTMQSEAKSEHWAQWFWRPLVGFTFCAVVVNNYILIPYFKNKGLLPVEVPSLVWEAVLAILGVASIGRAAVKWQDKKNEKE